MFLLQKGRCAICNEHHLNLKQGLCLDHDHETNKVRALLCHNCNRGLGSFKDSAEFIIKAYNYLIEHVGKAID